MDGITDSMDMNLSKLGDGEGQGSLACCSPQGGKGQTGLAQLNNRNNWKSSIKVKKETLHVLFPPRILLTGIQLG